MDGRLPDPEFWRGRRVLLTGHTGFKGSWAALWLSRLGAEVTGLALAPDTEPSLFELADVARDTVSIIADIREPEAVGDIVARARPQTVLHMAAQALVRRSLADPVGTWATNVMGTVHLLDALSWAGGVEAVLVVTSDKVYANSGTGRAFVESDPLGGRDPYSASKAAAELAAASYDASRFAPNGVRLGTARGGNVIGGGDFAADRIVPDIVRAIRDGRPPVLRHPEAVRPWQHVLDCVGGYLVHLEALARGEDVPSALNFGPAPGAPTSVGELADAVLAAMGAQTGWRHEPVPDSIEARTLSLDSQAARRTLRWRDRLAGMAGMAATARWYGDWLAGADMRAATLAEIDAFTASRGGRADA